MKSLYLIFGLIFVTNVYSQVNVISYDEALNEGRQACGPHTIENIGGNSTVINGSGTVIVVGGRDGFHRASIECSTARMIFDYNPMAKWVCVITGAKGFMLSSGFSSKTAYSASQDAFDKCTSKYSLRNCSQGRIPCFISTNNDSGTIDGNTRLKDIIRDSTLIAKQDIILENGRSHFKENIQRQNYSDPSVDTLKYTCKLNLGSSFKDTYIENGQKFEIASLKVKNNGAYLDMKFKGNYSNGSFSSNQFVCYSSNRLSEPGKPLTVNDFNDIIGDFFEIQQ